MDTPLESKEEKPESISIDRFKGMEPDTIKAGMSLADSYRCGGEGFVKWCNDFVCIPIYPVGETIPVWWPMSELPDEPHPETGRSYVTLWEAQAEEAKRGLVMYNGKFKYASIIFCWPRGEGKSFLACLIQLWKFFCWPQQKIMLAANSKDQVQFVHYDIMRDIILNSPKLLEIVGRKNIQEKEIRLKDKKGRVVSVIRSISSFSGIRSNITGYTFSEMFDLKNHRFYVQIDGSIRNVPNALGVIDSTVSTKDHVLFKIYNEVKAGTLKNTFFSYRCSYTGDGKDYWHPYMTQAQLNDYRAKFPFGEFERYFLNLWEAGKIEIFSQEMIEAMHIFGADGKINNHSDIMTILEEKRKLLQKAEDYAGRNYLHGVKNIDEQVDVLVKRFTKMDKIYRLGDHSGHRQMASIQDLENLSRTYDTDWAILCGVDRADPMKARTAARTIITIVAKGLIGSRSRPFDFMNPNEQLNYFYVLLDLIHVESSDLDEMKQFIEDANSEFFGIDALCGERWGLWDLATWCEERGIAFEAVFPTYDRQKSCFSELFVLVKDGRFKSSTVVVAGSRGDSILDEEMFAFDHDPDKHVFGSPEKMEKYGVQDDVMFSLGWGIYGGRELTVNDFRKRMMSEFFGEFIPNPHLVGEYR